MRSKIMHTFAAVGALLMLGGCQDRTEKTEDTENTENIDLEGAESGCALLITVDPGPAETDGNHLILPFTVENCSTATIVLPIVQLPGGGEGIFIAGRDLDIRRAPEELLDPDHDGVRGLSPQAQAHFEIVVLPTAQTQHREVLFYADDEDGNFTHVRVPIHF